MRISGTSFLQSNAFPGIQPTVCQSTKGNSKHWRPQPLIFLHPPSDSWDKEHSSTFNANTSNIQSKTAFINVTCTMTGNIENQCKLILMWWYTAASYLQWWESCDRYPRAYPSFVKSMLYSNCNMLAISWHINYIRRNSSIPTNLPTPLFHQPFIRCTWIRQSSSAFFFHLFQKKTST